MIKIPSKDYISDFHSPSIIDRLLDSPESNHEAKSAIMRDITNLLNTKVNLDINNDFNEVKTSILNYGLPNFSMMEASTKNISDEIQKSLEKTLLAYEPRLKNITVNVANVSKYSIDFTINATFMTDPEPINIKFDSNYQPNLQQFKVKEHPDE
ncbi:MAG: type VI secretion system baseplate subunit TssE [Gammaproteobacteria bacterium]|nr:type VI secretion system baseplate subunit TssE [Gammaproteobacteria bacterium]